MMSRLAPVALLAALLAAAVPVGAKQDPAVTEDYVFGVIVGRDDRKPIPDADAKRIQDLHMAHIRAMAEAGALVSAGPTDDPAGKIRGFFIFKTTMAEAARLANSDPTVTNNRNTIELYAWTAPKGIGEPYRKWAAENPGQNPTMVSRPVAFWRDGKTQPGASDTAGRRQRDAFTLPLFSSGKLISAGPFLGNGPLRGIYVFDCGPDEARTLAAQDPEVQSGRLQLDWLMWYSAERTFK